MRDIIAIGASAGGLRPLEQIAAALPNEPPLAVFVVQHIGPSRSILPDILTRAGPYRAFHPRDGDKVQTGAIHVAPPDRHMLVVDGRIRLALGPHENRTRPAIDPMMRSLAVAYGARVQGVLLSGGLDDGVAGLSAIQRCGGIVIVQDPNEAPMPSMPRAAIDAISVDYVVSSARIAPLLAKLALETPELPSRPPPEDIRLEVAIAAHEAGAHMETPYTIGTPTTLCCPTCHGTLWEIDEDGEPRYRCRTGHAFGALSLNAAQNEAAETAIIIALRTLDERAELYRHMAQRARMNKRHGLAIRWDRHLQETNDARDKLREALRMPSLLETMDE